MEGQYLGHRGLSTFGHCFCNVRCLRCIKFNMVWHVHRVNNCMQYGHCEGDLTGIILNTMLYSAVDSQLAFLQPTDP